MARERDKGRKPSKQKKTRERREAGRKKRESAGRSDKGRGRDKDKSPSRLAGVGSGVSIDPAGGSIGSGVDIGTSGGGIGSGVSFGDASKLGGLDKDRDRFSSSGDASRLTSSKASKEKLGLAQKILSTAGGIAGGIAGAGGGPIAAIGGKKLGQWAGGKLGQAIDTGQFGTGENTQRADVMARGDNNRLGATGAGDRFMKPRPTPVALQGVGQQTAGAGGAIGAAVDAETAGQQAAMEEQRRMLAGTMGQLNPYIETGEQALQQQRALTGLSGAEAQQQAFNQFAQSPGQKFLQDRAQRNLLRSSAAIGGLGGGNVREALVQQGIGFAQQDLDRTYGRLAGLSGQGLGAVGAGGQFGMGAASNIANLQTAGGASRASGILGQQQLQAAQSAAKQQADIKKQENIANILGLYSEPISEIASDVWEGISADWGW